MMEVELTTTFLPSEVARLVLGYLKEQQCVKAADSFLRTSIHLGEYRSMLDQGFSAPLTISGRTLVETLCLCQVDPGPVRRNTDQAELWGKLDHIVSQLKSFNATVSPKPSQLPVTNNKLRPVRIRQSGAEVKTRRRTGKESRSIPVLAVSGEVQADSSQPEEADSPRAKKHVTWSLPEEDEEAESNSTVVVLSKGEGDATISSSAASGSDDCLVHAPAQPSHQVQATPPVFTSQAELTNQLTGSPSASSHLPAVTAATSSPVTSPLSALTSEGHPRAELMIPEPHYDWSPYKKKEGKTQTSEKTEIDLEVSELLNQLFPMKNVVEKLVEDDAWAQDMAKSINERKDSQAHLAEEKVPQVLDITKADPNFTEFHTLLDGANRRKGKPNKKVVQDKPVVVEAPPGGPAYELSTEQQQQQVFSADLRQPLRQEASVKVKGNGSQPTVIGLEGIRRKQLYSSASSTYTNKDSCGAMTGAKRTRARKKTFTSVPRGSEKVLNSTPLAVSTASSNVIDIWPAPLLATNTNAVLQSSNMYVYMPTTGVGTEATTQSSFQPLTLVPACSSITVSPHPQPALQVLSSPQHNILQSVNLPQMSQSTQPTLSTGAQASGTGTLPSIVTFTQPPSTSRVTYSAGPQSTQFVTVQQALNTQATNAQPQVVPSSQANVEMDMQTSSKSNEGIKTPRKDDYSHLDLEQTTALLFSGASPAGKRKRSNDRFSSAQTSSPSVRSRSSELRKSQSDGRMPPLAKGSEDVNIVTAKWSPALKSLVDKCSPGKSSRRKTAHVRHLSFSPKGLKLTRSPKRPRLRGSPKVKKGLEVSSSSTRETPDELSSQQLMSPSRSNVAHPVRLISQEFTVSSAPQSTGGGMDTPPSVGEPPFASSPAFPYNNRLCSTPAQSPLVGDHSVESPASLCSPSMQTLRRSPRTAGKSTPSMRSLPARRIVPVARKGGPPISSRVTPSKGGSPSVVMAGKGGSITSITVAQSTPKGKNCVPTVISNSDLLKAVDAILDENSGNTLNSSDSAPSDVYPSLTSEEIVEASGVATPAGPSDDTVGVAQALMELASSESPLKTAALATDGVSVGLKSAEGVAGDRTPVNAVPVDVAPVDTVLVDTVPTDAVPVDTVAADTVPADTVPVDTVPVSSSDSAVSCGAKRKSALAKQKQRQRRTPKKMSAELKKMSVQAMLDMIHK